MNVRHYGRPQNWHYLRQYAGQIELAVWARIKPDPSAKATRGRGRLRAV